MYIVGRVWPWLIELTQFDVGVVSPLVAVGTEGRAQSCTYGSLSVVGDVDAEYLPWFKPHGFAFAEIGVEQIVSQYLEAFGMVDSHDIVGLFV